MSEKMTDTHLVKAAKLVGALKMMMIHVLPYPGATFESLLKEANGFLTANRPKIDDEFLPYPPGIRGAEMAIFDILKFVKRGHTT